MLKVQMIFCRNIIKMLKYKTVKKRGLIDIFIGGAWPYANYYLHVGHLAALFSGDILAKYFRWKGDNVIYVSGSDCHGTPITERSKKMEFLHRK